MFPYQFLASGLLLAVTDLEILSMAEFGLLYACECCGSQEGVESPKAGVMKAIVITSCGHWEPNSGPPRGQGVLRALPSPAMSFLKLCSNLTISGEL